MILEDNDSGMIWEFYFTWELCLMVVSEMWKGWVGIYKGLDSLETKEIMMSLYQSYIYENTMIHVNVGSLILFFSI